MTKIVFVDNPSLGINCGDEAVLASLLQTLLPGVQPVLIGNKVKQFKEDFGLPLVLRTRNPLKALFKIPRMMKTLKKGDCYVVSGGNILYDSSSAFNLPYNILNLVLAKKAGLKEGDRIEKIDGKEFDYYHEFRTELESVAGQTVTLDIKRPTDKEMTQFSDEQINVKVGEDSLIGIQVIKLLEVTSLQYSFLESIPKGTDKAFSVVWVNIKAFGKMFQGDLSPTKSLRGPLGIMKTFGVTWNWVRFWTLTGLISMVLAFMNLLPIPALDGGHVVFLMYEIISGRKPSDKFLENAQKVGMVLLLGLMVFVFFNDIIQEFF